MAIRAIYMFLKPAALFFENALQDLAYAVRQLRKSIGFSVTAILTIALGVGASTAIFSFVNGTLLKPLRYPQADQIVNIWEKPPFGVRRNRTSSLTFLDWRNEKSLFRFAAAEVGESLPLTGQGEPVVLRTERVSAPYFRIFGVNAALGRTFAGDEETPGKENVAVISNRLWRDHFGGSRDVLGRTITLDGKEFTLIGVMPADSRFNRGWADAWIPLLFEKSELNRNFHWLQVWARLRPGVTLQRCRQQMAALAQRISEAYPLSNQGWGVIVDRYADVVVDDPLRTSLYMLLSAVGLLFLIGCINLANLLFVRGADREQELAIRRALGADSWRLGWQLMSESLLLSLIGGSLGVALSFGLIHILKQVLPPYYLPPEATITLDLHTLLLAVGLVFFAAGASGIFPALQSVRASIRNSLQEQSRSATRGRHSLRVKNALIIAEMAISFALIVGASLLVRSFYNLQEAPTGFDAHRAVTAWIPVADSAKLNPIALTNYDQQILDAAKSVPGANSVALTSALPVDGSTMGTQFQVAGRPAVSLAKRPVAFLKIISPDYFKTLHIKLLEGRSLTKFDTKNSRRVIVINQSLAKKYFLGQDPIGKLIFFQDIDLVKNQLGQDLGWEIAGVVADEKITDLYSFWTCIYVSNRQIPSPVLALVLRTTADPKLTMKSVEAAVWKINKNQPFDRVRTVQEIESESVSSERLRTTLLFAFALFALLLSAIGIYGVIAWSVGQRTHEMGVRTALGASRWDVARLILQNTLHLVFVAIGIGTGCAFAITRLLSNLLFHVPASDLLSFGMAVILLVSVALSAGLIPALQAASLTPLAALRHE